jgi:hypothetical protein
MTSVAKLARSRWDNSLNSSGGSGGKSYPGKGFRGRRCRVSDRQLQRLVQYCLTEAAFSQWHVSNYDGVPFEEKMAALTAALAVQMKQAEVLVQEIKTQLAKVGFEV